MSTEDGVREAMSNMDRNDGNSDHNPQRFDGKEIEGLEKRLASGLRFTNMLAYLGQEGAKDNKALLYSLIELLVSKGVIHLHELEQRKKSVGESLEQGDGKSPQVYLVDTPDKYQCQELVEIDCAARYPLCRAICCKLWFSLSVQDLDERIVKWDYAHPYGIAKGEDGFCVHFNREGCTCGVYENRPLVCRTYDCRRDKRIWLDFEKGVVNPEINDNSWPGGATVADRDVDTATQVDPKPDTAEPPN